MKAMVLHEVRTPLVLEERHLPSPAPGEIRLVVEACAVCRADLHMVERARRPRLSSEPRRLSGWE
jgi:alcohol dehydrogenase, propanol-preferring